jgi:heme-degrading monooxygenase HmoA
MDYAGRTRREEIIMSVVVSAVTPGLNAELYEAVTSRVMPDDQLPEGNELHIAGPVAQGWQVITVWESREAFERFREEKLLPAIREVAGDQAPSPGEPEVNPVHKLVKG